MPRRLAQQAMILSDLEWPFYASSITFVWVSNTIREAHYRCSNWTFCLIVRLINLICELASYWLRCGKVPFSAYRLALFLHVDILTNLFITWHMWQLCDAHVYVVRINYLTWVIEQMKLWFHRPTVSRQNSAAPTTVVLTCHCAAMQSTTAQTGPTRSTAVHYAVLCFDLFMQYK